MSEAADDSGQAAPLTGGPDHAVILAAGYGSRLDPDPGFKILVEIGGVPLLDRHLANFQRLGVREVTVVTGFDHAELESRLEEWETPGSMRLHTAYNSEFDLGNGISVLTGMRGGPVPAEATTPCWMTMSDHVFEPVLFERLASRRPWRGWKDADLGGVLAVDRKLDSVYDMPDANKVRVSDATVVNDDGSREGHGEIPGGRLEGIGKKLESFQLVDVGLFWCDDAFADALEAERGVSGDCWTSDAVRRLGEAGQFAFWDIGDVQWGDVDTPEDRNHAEQLSEGFRD
jgi:choline kinase